MQNFTNLTPSEGYHHPTSNDLLKCVHHFVFLNGLSQISYTAVASNNTTLISAEYERIDKLYRPCISIRCVKMRRKRFTSFELILYFSMTEKLNVRKHFQDYENSKLLAPEEDYMFALLDSQDELILRVGEGFEFVKEVIDDIIHETVHGKCN